MTTISIAVPDILAKFEELKAKEILLGAIRYVIVQKFKEEKKEKENAMKNIRRYEKKHKMSFEEFERKMPQNGDYRLHEDWIEWSFWNDVCDKIQDEMKRLQKHDG